MPRMYGITCFAIYDPSCLGTQLAESNAVEPVSRPNGDIAKIHRRIALLCRPHPPTPPHNSNLAAVPSNNEPSQSSLHL